MCIDLGSTLRFLRNSDKFDRLYESEKNYRGRNLKDPKGACMVLLLGRHCHQESKKKKTGTLLSTSKKNITWSHTSVQLHQSRVKYLGDHKIVKVWERSRKAANPTMPWALRLASCWAMQSLSMKTIFGSTRPRLVS